jgi:hypothetical protein
LEVYSWGLGSRQGLCQSAAEQFDEHIDQQHIRLAARVDHIGRGQNVEKLWRTRQAFASGLLCGCCHSQSISWLAACDGLCCACCVVSNRQDRASNRPRNGASCGERRGPQQSGDHSAWRQ